MPSVSCTRRAATRRPFVQRIYRSRVERSRVRAHVRYDWHLNRISVARRANSPRARCGRSATSFNDVLRIDCLAPINKSWLRQPFLIQRVATGSRPYNLFYIKCWVLNLIIPVDSRPQKTVSRRGSPPWLLAKKGKHRALISRQIVTDSGNLS